MKPIFVKLPKIKLQRITLRQLYIEDANDLFEYCKIPVVGPNAGWKPHDNIEETIEFINFSINNQMNGQPGIFVIIDNYTNKVIGTIEIHHYELYKAELGYVLHPDYWGKGLMVEAGEAVIKFAFESLLIERLAIFHFVDNKRSQRVIEKLGFIYEGILRKYFMSYDGKTRDSVIYSITRDDYYK